MVKLHLSILAFYAKMRSFEIKKILVIAVYLVVTNILPAQSYYNSPGDSLVKSTTLDQTVAMSITQQHPTSDTVYFKWHQLSVTMPTGWDASICDNGHCFTTLMDSGMMIPIVPGDNGLMLLHCTPHLTAGTGIIRYTLYASNTPSHVDTLTWIVNATYTGIEALSDTKPLLWYSPNKIHLNQSCQNYETLRMLDMDGKIVFKAKIRAVPEIEIPILPLSTYIIELSENENVVYQKIVNHQ